MVILSICDDAPRRVLSDARLAILTGWEDVVPPERRMMFK
jgi:hypothetical protein